MPWAVTVMVIAIVLITTIGRVAKERYRAMQRVNGAGVTSAETMRANEEVRALKDRIVVLERLITDTHGSVDLDRQIEQLRDR